MSHYRLLCLAASAGIAGCLYKTLADKWPNDSFKVKAQTEEIENEENYTIEWTPLGIWDISFYNLVPSTYEPWTSTPKKSSGPLIKTPGVRKWAPFCDHPPNRKHPPMCRDMHEGISSGCDVKVCRNVYAGLPNWTMEFLSSDKMGDHHSCRFCQSLREGCRCANPVEVYENNPGFMAKFKEYCKWDIDPCAFHALPPMVTRAHIQSNRLWDDLYHYILFLTEEYEEVNICSGPCFTTREMTNQEKCLYPNYTNCKIAELSHFYKIITVYNDEDETFHNDCFLIPYDTTGLECPDISKYRLSKFKLEEQLGVQLLGDRLAYLAGDVISHPEYEPHKKCTLCFPNQVDPPEPCQIAPPPPPCQLVPEPSVCNPVVDFSCAEEPCVAETSCAPFTPNVSEIKCSRCTKKKRRFCTIM